MAKVVGPGAATETPADIKPQLEGATEYEVVTILNPLTDDFQVRVAQDVPVNMPVEIRSKTGLIQSDKDVVSNYGINLKNPDHKAVKYIYNDTIIPAGQTMNFRGDQAQVVVKQLVAEIMQREGKARMLADPVARAEVESRIIRHKGSIQDIMDSQFKSSTQQIDEALSQSNKTREVDNEQAFPELAEPGQTGQSEAGGVTQSEPVNQDSPRRAGRPKKTE